MDNKKIFILWFVAFIATSLVVGCLLYQEEEVTIKVEDVDYDFSSKVWLVEKDAHIIEVQSKEKFLALVGNESIWASARVNDRSNGIFLRYWSKTTSPEYILKGNDMIFPGEEIIVFHEEAYRVENFSSFWEVATIKEINRGEIIAIRNNCILSFLAGMLLFAILIIAYFHFTDKKDREKRLKNKGSQ